MILTCLFHLEREKKRTIYQKKKERKRERDICIFEYVLQRSRDLCFPDTQIGYKKNNQNENKREQKMRGKKERNDINMPP